jgi:hypothetical protein
MKNLCLVGELNIRQQGEGFTQQAAGVSDRQREATSSFCKRADKMKFYVHTSIISILLGFTLVGCARQETGETSATRNRTGVEETKVSPEPVKNNPTESSDSARAITVYKSPTCGCCTEWESHMTKAGFLVTSKPTENMEEVRKQYDVPEKVQSCHTAVIVGYVVEGHVPADDVKRLLESRPDGVAGLAAPEMPQKSPGMQPEGEKPSGYEVLSFDRQGNSKVFASYK